MRVARQDLSAILSRHSTIKVSNCNARREACVSDRLLSFFLFKIAGDSTLSSIVTYLWYLRNTICKTSMFGDIVQTRRGAYCDREDSEIALLYVREKGRVQKTRYQHVRVRYTYIPRIVSSTSRCSSAAP